MADHAQESDWRADVARRAWERLQAEWRAEDEAVDEVLDLRDRELSEVT